MKKTLTIITALFLFSTACHAQNLDGADSTVQNFKKYLTKNIRYVAVARENDVTGVAVLTVKINANKKIDDIVFLKHLSAELDSEVIKRVKNYDKVISLPEAEYTIGFSFNMQHDEGVVNIKPIDNSQYSNYLFDVDILGYATQRRSTIVY